jgi:hypothetical protein
MRRLTMVRCIAAFTLVLSASLLVPAGAAAGPPAPGIPAGGAHPGVLQSIWSWFHALLAWNAPGALRGAPVRIDKGNCIDPNGQCN